MRFQGHTAATFLALSTALIASMLGAAPASADLASDANPPVISSLIEAKPNIAPVLTRRSKLKGTLKGVKAIVVLNTDGTQYGRITPKANGAFSFYAVTGASLQVIGADGAYAGPIVLSTSKNKKLAYTFFNAKKLGGTIDLGKIKLGSGYAVAGKSIASKYVDTSKAASSVAKKGVPVAAPKGGLVTVATQDLLSSAAITLPSADLDRDGYPNVFDIDNNGNSVLNNVDSDTTRAGSIKPVSIFTLRAGTRAKSMDVCPAPPAPAPVGCTPAGPAATDPAIRIFSNFKSTDPNLKDAVNYNLYPAGTSTATILAAIDKALANSTSLAVSVVEGGFYSCAMVYCPSTAFAPIAGPTGDFQWPIGAGVTGASLNPAYTPSIAPYPGLTHSDIGSGDAFSITLPTDTDPIPGVLNFAFTTNPVLKSYQVVNADGSLGTETNIVYSPGAGADRGTTSNPIVVPGGGRVKLNWYVPQRLAVAGETTIDADGVFVNMGNLGYYADMPNAPRDAANRQLTGRGGKCSGGSMFTGSGTAEPGEAVTDGDVDDAAPGRTFSFQVDLDKCVGNMYPGGGTTWSTLDFDIQAQSKEGDNAAVKIYFKRG